MRTFEWAIEDIIAAYPTLVLDHYALKAVALMKRFDFPFEIRVHVDGFEISELDGDTEFVAKILWTPKTEKDSERMERTEQRLPIVEGAAIAMSALLFAHLVADSEMEVMAWGDRADYWFPKLHRVVEVSGTERFDEMSRRFRKKRRQVQTNRLGLAGYVVICCFCKIERVIRWTYHSHQNEE